MSTEPFIVSGSPFVLRAISEVSGQDPDLTVLSISGSPETPERLVVQMPRIRAQLLVMAFPGTLRIEPDRPLPPIPTGPSGPTGPPDPSGPLGPLGPV